MQQVDNSNLIHLDKKHTNKIQNKVYALRYRYSDSYLDTYSWVR